MAHVALAIMGRAQWPQEGGAAKRDNLIMREVVYKGYRIRLLQVRGWLAFVIPPERSVPWAKVISATVDEGPDALLALVKAHIEEDIIDAGGRFLDG